MRSMTLSLVDPLYIAMPIKTICSISHLGLIISNFSHLLIGALETLDLL